MPFASNGGPLLKGEIGAFLSKTPSDIESDHLSLLSKEISRARASPVYGDGCPDIDDWGDLDQIPAIGYDRLDRTFKEFGLEASLLAHPDHFYHTSGYTGVSKRMYYSDLDVARMARNYALFGHLTGIRPGMTGWSIAGEEPLVSGPTLHNASKVLGMDLMSTLLAQDTDLRHALTKASRSTSFDVMAGTPLLFYVIGRIVDEPGYFRTMVERAARNKYHIPGPLAKLVARALVRGIDIPRLEDNVRSVRIGISYAEPLSPYLQALNGNYPNMKAHDVLGSTECPLIAAQYHHAQKGLQLFLPGVVAEIADPRDIRRSRDERSPLKAIPWHEWTAGLKGELLISRPGDCLPLIRYATGDLIEVLDPRCATEVQLEDGPYAVVSPSIKVLGRSVDTLDFEAHDESGNYLGCKIYSRHIQEALGRSENVRWWELYDVGARPSRLVFVIIPEHPVQNVDAFRKEVLRRLLHECNDLLGTLKMGQDLDRLQVLVAEPSAYAHVQVEMDERARAGRSLGQLKPKHIFRFEDETAFQDHLLRRLR